MDENGLLFVATSPLSPGACALSVAPLFILSSRAIAHTRIRLFSVFTFTSSPRDTKRCATAHYRVKEMQ